ncbi:MAG: hypothetical protein Q9159_001975 [Coniocarpon cinnabarinum]
MYFTSNDRPNLRREKESTCTHPDTGETFVFRFVMTKNSENNTHTYTDDTDDGYDSEDFAQEASQDFEKWNVKYIMLELFQVQNTKYIRKGSLSHYRTEELGCDFVQELL